MVLDHVLPKIIRQEGEAVVKAYTMFLERQRSEGTRYNYGYAVTRFISWLALHRTSLPEVSEKLINEYVCHMAQYYSSSTQRGMICALRYFFDVLVDEGIVQANPVQRVRIKMQDGYFGIRSGSLGTNDIHELLTRSEKASFHTLRDLVIIRLLLEGVKCVELLEIRRSDYVREAQRHQFVLHGRSGDSKYFWLGPTTRECLDAYLAIARLSGDPGQLLFQCRHSWSKVPISTGLSNVKINIIVRKWGIRRRISNLTPNVLRATGIRLYLRSGRTAREVARQFGISYRQVFNYKRRAWQDGSSSNGAKSKDGSLLYEGDIDGLVALLDPLSRSPLQQFIEERGIFRLSMVTDNQE